LPNSVIEHLKAVMAINTDKALTEKRRQRIKDAAERAKAEAEARREGIDAVGITLPDEVDGRDGLEPTRFGDWEVDGRATDF
jgi:hypothetical protein